MAKVPSVVKAPVAVKVPAVAKPENHSKPWTPEEDQKLVSRFDAKVALEVIAKKHKRGIGGIQSRLTKLGKLVAEAPVPG